MRSWSVRVEFNQNGNSLTHYGVKGMRWGVRKDNYTSGYNRRPSKSGAPKFKYVATPSDPIGTALKTAAAVTSVIPVTIPIGLGLAIASAAREKRQNARFLDISEIPEQPERPLDSLPRKNKETSANDDVKRINNIRSTGGVNNCVNCILAYDMRRRGYDVSAAPTNKPAYTPKVIEEVYGKKVKPLSVSIPKSELTDSNNMINKRKASEAGYNKMVKTAEETFKPGQRGFVAITYWGQNVGHVLNWEMSDKGIDFYDAQSGQKSKGTLYNFSGAIPIYNLYRLDDLTPNDKITTRLKDGSR